MRRISFARATLAALLCLGLSVPVLAAPKTAELLRVGRDGLRADWGADRAFARGVGRVARAGAVGHLLARRAALLDARRGLLILRGDLLRGRGARKARSVSGVVPPVKILTERCDGELYVVEVEASLSGLLASEGRAYVVCGIDDLHRKEGSDGR
ncbi:MAG: hypothetical protein IJR14_10635 [Synergistaceae bacterium]|nr:hypothetical protein [Synergistaceae bacterium]